MENITGLDEASLPKGEIKGEQTFYTIKLNARGTIIEIPKEIAFKSHVLETSQKELWKKIDQEPYFLNYDSSLVHKLVDYLSGRQIKDISKLKDIADELLIDIQIQNEQKIVKKRSKLCDLYGFNDYEQTTIKIVKYDCDFGVGNEIINVIFEYHQCDDCKSDPQSHCRCSYEKCIYELKKWTKNGWTFVGSITDKKIFNEIMSTIYLKFNNKSLNINQNNYDFIFEIIYDKLGYLF